MPRSRRTRVYPAASYRCVEKRRRSTRREPQPRRDGNVYVSATTSLVVRRPASPRRGELLLAYPRRNPRAGAYLVATVMAELPDISHLTPEERRIIESVMMRQKQEEEQENEIMR